VPIDAFARGELDSVALEHFRSRYLSTARGREMTRFAEALQGLDENSGGADSSERPYRVATPVDAKWRGRDRLALAAAVVMLAIASAWLAIDNRMLRGRVTSAEVQRDQQLREAASRTPADTTLRPQGQAPSRLPVATLVLAPQLRSARQLPTVRLTDGTGELPVQLELEPVDYPSYEVSLIAARGDQRVWRGDRLTPTTIGGRNTIDLHLPATVLSPQDYLIRVSGIPARGGAEIVGEYRFTVVR
jgi:type II secretory pathway component PulM